MFVAISILLPSALSLVLLLIVVILYRKPPKASTLEKKDRLIASKKGISYESLIESRAKRRARKIPKQIRQKIMIRDGFKCQHCKTSEQLTIDHIVPFSLGGSNDPNNLQVLCLKCNQKKANH